MPGKIMDSLLVTLRISDKESGGEFTSLCRKMTCRTFRRSVCVAIEKFVQVGLLPERGSRQNNARERYKLNDKPQRLIASDRGVEIHPQGSGSDQVNDSNYIAQISVTHDLLLKYGFPSSLRI